MTRPYEYKVVDAVTVDVLLSDKDSEVWVRFITRCKEDTDLVVASLSEGVYWRAERLATLILDKTTNEVLKCVYDLDTIVKWWQTEGIYYAQQ